MEGPTLQNYDPDPAIKLLAEGTIQRPKQTRKKKYKPRETKRASKVLIDRSSTESESAESQEDEQQELIPELNELE